MDTATRYLLDAMTFVSISWIVDVEARSKVIATYSVEGNRPFARSSHMVQIHTCWDASCTVGIPRQRHVKVDWYELLCFGSPTVQIASKHVWFCTMWPGRAKGLFPFRVTCIACKTTTIGHFRVTLCLCFKTSLRAKPFTWKWVWFAWKWTRRRNTFPHGCSRTKTRFDTKAEGNSKMAYYH